MSALTDPLKKKQEFFAINALRFLAAFWVLLFHTSIHFGKINYLSFIQPVLDQGTLAMTLFFMLSGFILSYRYSSFSNKEDLPNYFASRIARLYPVYLFMGITTLWRLGDGANRFWIIENWGYIGAIPFALFAIFLFIFAAQAWFPSLFSIWNFGGSWSLSVEAFFYTLFPSLRERIGRFGNRALTFSTILLPFIIFCISTGLLLSLTTENNTSKIFYVLPIFRLPEFLLGICGYILFVERGLHRRALAITGWVFTFVLIAGIYWQNLPGLLDWSFPASITFLSIFVFSLDIHAPRLVKQFINYLGRISYCLYMAQFTTIPVLKKFKGVLSIEQEWALAIVCTLLFAIITYHLIEVIPYKKAKDIAYGIYCKIRDFLETKK